MKIKNGGVSIKETRISENERRKESRRERERERDVLYIAERVGSRFETQRYYSTLLSDLQCGT